MIEGLSGNACYLLRPPCYPTVILPGLFVGEWLEQAEKVMVFQLELAHPKPRGFQTTTLSGFRGFGCNGLDFGV